MTFWLLCGVRREVDWRRAWPGGSSGSWYPHYIICTNTGSSTGEKIWNCGRVVCGSWLSIVWRERGSDGIGETHLRLLARVACLMSARCSSNVGQGIRSQNCKWKWRRILTFLHRNVCLIKTYCQIFHSSSLQIVIILKCFFFLFIIRFFLKRITLTERYR